MVICEFSGEKPKKLLPIHLSVMVMPFFFTTFLIVFAVLFTVDTRTRLLHERGMENCHILLPSELIEQQKDAIEAEIKRGNAFKADTISGLAEQMGMNAEVLEKTIARYNELCEKGVDEDYGKDPAHLKKFEAPYVGFKMYGNINDAYTGLRINVNAQVFGTDGNIIEGLYACSGEPYFG